MIIMMIKVPRTTAPPTAAIIATLLSFPFVCESDGEDEAGDSNRGGDNDGDGNGDFDGVCVTFPVEVSLGGFSVEFRKMGTDTLP